MPASPTIAATSTPRCPAPTRKPSIRTSGTAPISVCRTATSALNISTARRSTLTIAPLVLLDSYDAIATFLLFLYLPLIVLSAYVMWRAFSEGAARQWRTGVAVFASTSLFLPVLQAYGQREFEIVILFLTTCAFYALVTSRSALAGALIGYTAWFKFFPLAFLGYFALRQWKSAVAAFLLVSAALLALTDATLGLRRFGAVAELASVEVFASVAPQGFCEAWSQPETRHHALANATRVSVRWAFCSFADRWTMARSADAGDRDPGRPARGVCNRILATAARAAGHRRRALAPIARSQPGRHRAVALLARALLLSVVHDHPAECAARSLPRQPGS